MAVKTLEKIKPKYTKYKQGAAAFALGLMTMSDEVYAEDPIKRLLKLQLKKGIITQQEYDEFISATDADLPAPVETQKKVEPAKQAGSPDNGTSNGPTSTSSEGGVSVLKTDNFKVEVFGTIDLSVGYTSHSLVQNGEMPTSIGPYIYGGVRYPRTTPTGPGGAQVPYPASNMSSQVGLFNSALSLSSWGIRATRD